MNKAYPLQWPLGHKRTNENVRNHAPFRQLPEKVQQNLKTELAKLKAMDVVISTNIPQRKDGFYYTDMATTAIDDPGVAVYFTWNKRQIVMCCDRFLTVMDNTDAIARSLKAVRDMERWGVSEFLERTFSGFKAIPEKVTRDIREILDLPTTAGHDRIIKAYKEKLFLIHPDKGGARHDFEELQTAYRDYMAENK